MSDIGLTVSIVYEPPGRYDVIVRVACDSAQFPDAVTFTVAADRAASCRSASIISLRTADAISALSRSTHQAGTRPRPSPAPSYPAR